MRRLSAVIVCAVVAGGLAGLTPGVATASTATSTHVASQKRYVTYLRDTLRTDQRRTTFATGFRFDDVAPEKANITRGLASVQSVLNQFTRRTTVRQSDALRNRAVSIFTPYSTQWSVLVLGGKTLTAAGFGSARADVEQRRIADDAAAGLDMTEARKDFAPVRSVLGRAYSLAKTAADSALHTDARKPGALTVLTRARSTVGAAQVASFDAGARMDTTDAAIVGAEIAASQDGRVTRRFS